MHTFQIQSVFGYFLRYNVASTLHWCIPKYYSSWKLLFSKADKRELETKTPLCKEHGLKKKQQLACVKQSGAS